MTGLSREYTAHPDGYGKSVKIVRHDTTGTWIMDSFDAAWLMNRYEQLQKENEVLMAELAAVRAYKESVK